MALGCPPQILQLEMGKQHLPPIAEGFYTGMMDIPLTASHLRRCDHLTTLPVGKCIHSCILKCGLHNVTFVENLLVEMYGKCEALWDARLVFDHIFKRNSFTWSIMLAAYVEHNYLKEALQIFTQIPHPNAASCISVIRACVKQGQLKFAVHLLEQFPQEAALAYNIVISAYIRAGQWKNAITFFCKMPHHDIVSWNIMLAAHIQQGNIEEALKFFIQMPERNIISWNSMISAYAQHGCLKKAMNFFTQMPERNISSWNAMIAAYVHQKKFEEAIRVFEQMPQRDVFSWNSMMSIYAHLGQYKAAVHLFWQMPFRNLVSWNAVIAIYSQQEELEEALSAFQQSQQEGIRPDKVTFVSLLDACSKNAALIVGKWLHKQLARYGLLSDNVVQNALVNMYARCGSLDVASAIFSKMSERDIISWNGILAACAQHGRGREAIEYFVDLQRQRRKGIWPNELTLSSLLSACNHAGMSCESCHYFNSMALDYVVRTTSEHHGCMVDLLGQLGHLDEAEALISSMPFQADDVSWKALLSACEVICVHDKQTTGIAAMLPLETAHFHRGIRSVIYSCYR